MPNTGSLTPAKKSAAKVIIMTIIAVPRSLPMRMRPMTPPAPGITTGTSACFVWARSFTLLLSTVAIHRANASFEASEGWKVKGPTSIQFWLPRALRPTSSTSTSRMKAMMIPSQAKRLSHTTLTLDSRNIQNRPMAANRPCLRAAV